MKRRKSQEEEVNGRRIKERKENKGMELRGKIDTWACSSSLAKTFLNFSFSPSKRERRKRDESTAQIHQLTLASCDGNIFMSKIETKVDEFLRKKENVLINDYHSRKSFKFLLSCFSKCQVSCTTFSSLEHVLHRWLFFSCPCPSGPLTQLRNAPVAVFGPTQPPL